MTTTTAPDPLAAWATASRDEELAAWRAMYDALHPAPAKPDCSHLHGAFGPGCPWCSPHERAAGQSARCATTTTQEGRPS